MAVIRDELRTGLLVVFTSTVLAAVLIYLEAPGISGQRTIYRVYFDNANGINVGAPVMLVGRKVGQVARIISPVPVAERPRPELEAVVEVAVDPRAVIYREEKVTMLQYSLLAEQVIDFSKGNETSGLAPANSQFIGERQLGLSEAGQKVLDKLDPVIGEATLAIKTIQATGENLRRMTEEESDLAMAMAQFRQFSAQMVTLSGSDGAIQHTLDNLQALTGKESPLANTLTNAERFTGQLADNQDVSLSLRNFRRASENFNSTARSLKGSVGGVQPGIKRTVRNAEQFTDTIKRQPWRLIWPSTKKYPEDKKGAKCTPTPKCSPMPKCDPPRGLIAR